jgi:hypothetical protein
MGLPHPNYFVREEDEGAKVRGSTSSGADDDDDDGLICMGFIETFPSSRQAALCMLHVVSLISIQTFHRSRHILEGMVVDFVENL